MEKALSALCAILYLWFLVGAACLGQMGFDVLSELKDVEWAFRWFRAWICFTGAGSLVAVGWAIIIAICAFRPSQRSAT